MSDRAAPPSHQLGFDDMALFVRVAALGTLSAVARERNVPVSQISRALQRIEAAWGVRLVRRSTHGLSLTAEGHALLEHGERVLALLRDLDAELAGRSDEVSGLVTISTSSVVAEHLIVPSLPALRQRYPRLRLDLRVEDRIVDMAREGIDIALRTGNPVTDTLASRPLGVLRRRLYASPDYVRQHGMPRDLADLEQHAIVTNSANLALNRWAFKTGSVARGFVAQGGFRSDSTAVTAAMTLAGLGIGRIITLVGEPLVAKGRLLRVLDGASDEPAVPLNAVMLAQRHRHPKIRACIDHWVDWFARLEQT